MIEDPKNNKVVNSPFTKFFSSCVRNISGKIRNHLPYSKGGDFFILFFTFEFNLRITSGDVLGIAVMRALFGQNEGMKRDQLMPYLLLTTAARLL